MGNKIGRKLLIFAGVVTVCQLYVFHHYNSLFAGTGGGAQTVKSPSQIASQQKEIAAEIKRLQSKYTFVNVSTGDEYAAYLDTNNVLYIEDLQTRKVVSEANNPYKVEYVEWIGNQRVFVGEQVSPGDLELKTVDESTGTQTIITRFQGLSYNAAFAKITFSTYTNDIYILINTNSASAVYHIGTMSNVSDVPIGGRFIKNIAVSETGDRLYFEDRINGSYNVLYFDSQNVPHLVELNAALVQVVGNTLYYGKINSNGYVISVYKLDANGQSQLISTLPSPTLAADIDITDSGGIQVNSPTT